MPATYVFPTERQCSVFRAISADKPPPSPQVNGNAPFFGAFYGVSGNFERICSVFQAVFKPFSDPKVNGINRYEWVGMLRFRHLTAEHINGEARRPGNAWHEDLDVPSSRVNSSDYKGSGWTRGHMCPAGDCKWDIDVMYESFLYSNCCPPNANLNTGTWNQIEIACRRWAEKYGEVYVVCGPILFRQEHEVIGGNKVVVPEAFFKVILCLNDKNPKGIGFICRNTDGNRKKDLYVNSIKQVERVTGMTFFPNLSDDVKDKVKNSANIDDW